MDLSSAICPESALAALAQSSRAKQHTHTELGLGVLENVARDARLVGAVGDALLEVRQHVGQVLVAAGAKLLGLCALLAPHAQQRDVVLPVVARGAKVGNHALDVGYLAQQRAVDGALDAEAIVERERRVEGEARDVRDGVDVAAAAVAVVQQLADARRALEVDDGHVRLHGGPVERRGRRLAPPLARVVPRRRANGEALRGGHDRVKGVKGWARDERRLVRDPKVLDRVVRVDKDDALEGGGGFRCVSLGVKKSCLDVSLQLCWHLLDFLGGFERRDRTWLPISGRRGHGRCPAV